MKRLSYIAAVAALGTITSGCGMGLANRVLPGSPGTGSTDHTITVKMADVGNLVPNSEVKVADKTVGTVKHITLDGWTAEVTIGLSDGVDLPQNSIARIGQKSLLGSEYVELAAPAALPGAGTAAAPLRDGAVIPLARTGRYTSTEELLGALSLWLNGGGLHNIQTITTEVNRALRGNGQNARQLIENLGRFSAGLDAQKGQIVAAISSVNELSARLAEQSRRMARALDRLPEGLEALDRQRGSLVGALAALDDLSRISTRVVRTSGQNLAQELNDLKPALDQINAAADSLPDVLDIAGTVLFPVKAVPNVVKGDYLNAAVTVDLTLPSIASGFFPNTPEGRALNAIQTALQASDPLTGPITEAVNSTTEQTHVGSRDEITSPPSSAPSPSPSPTGSGTGLGGVLGDFLDRGN